MASTTTSKKEIVDFLWEWAEGQGDWSKILVDKIVNTEGALADAEREVIFNYYLQSLNLYTGLPAVSISKPTYTPTDKRIELSSLSEIKGVNRLAKNQIIEFSPQVTVVYGENGTGKTGYGRILKTLGFSYDLNNNVYHNVFGTREPQTATIKYTANENPGEFIWDGSNRSPDLQNICVFNSNCVQISLSDRQLIVSPIGFHLFNLVSTELGELAALLQKKILSYPITLAWAAALNEGTAQQVFVNTLSKNSTEERLTQLASFTEDHDAELNSKDKELNDLNRTLIETELRTLAFQESELAEIIKTIQDAQLLFSEESWKNFIDINRKITDEKSKTQTGIKEIAEGNGIEFYETAEFQKFIASAEEYIKIIGNSEYPSNADSCIYCKQPLESTAAQLLKSYRELLNDKTQENLQKLNAEKALLSKQIAQINSSFVLHQASFGLTDEQLPVEPEVLITFKKDFNNLKEKLITDSIESTDIFILDYAGVLKTLLDKKVEITGTGKTKREMLSNLDAKEKELRTKVAELKDRKLLSTKKEEIKSVINSHKTIANLNAKGSSFSTSAISRKTTEAREELVKQNFNDLFKNELKALRKSNLKIELNFATDRGNSKVIQKIERHQLSEILSEGEQKAIALAEFLTELQLDNIKAPVIFDDPVNSLDHHIIDEVAKRLIELSKERQVVIFTHSILLLNSFIQQSELDTNKQEGIGFKFLSVINNFGETGIIDDVEELNSYTYYTGKLNTILNTSQANQREEQLAREGYGYLRSAIEVAVEENVLQKVIKRYRKGVAFPALLRIEGGKIDGFKGKLNDIYEKCCVSITAHSSPEEIHSTPTIDQLKMDFEEVKEIRKNFLSN